MKPPSHWRLSNMPQKEGDFNCYLHFASLIMWCSDFLYLAEILRNCLISYMLYIYLIDLIYRNYFLFAYLIMWCSDFLYLTKILRLHLWLRALDVDLVFLLQILQLDAMLLTQLRAPPLELLSMSRLQLRHALLVLGLELRETLLVSRRVLLDHCRQVLDVGRRAVLAGLECGL